MYCQDCFAAIVQSDRLYVLQGQAAVEIAEPELIEVAAQPEAVEPPAPEPEPVAVAAERELLLVPAAPAPYLPPVTTNAHNAQLWQRKQEEIQRGERCRLSHTHRKHPTPRFARGCTCACLYCSPPS